MPPPLRRPEPRICLYSVGWSDVPDHAESFVGFAFDISEVQGDADRRAARWDFFGGQGGALDHELSQIQILHDLDGLLRNLLHRCTEKVEEADRLKVDLPTIIITVCYAWGKHRSRFVVERAGRWFQDQLEDMEHIFFTAHLSDRSRWTEVQHSWELKAQGLDHARAVASARQMGLRRRRREFNDIKWTMYRRLREAGYGKCWVDVLEYRPCVELLDWCAQLLPSPVAPRSASTSQEAHQGRSPFGVATSASHPRPAATSAASAISQRTRTSLPDFGGSLVGSPPRGGQSSRAAAESEVSEDSLSGDDDGLSALLEDLGEDQGRLANDPDRPRGDVRRTSALERDQERIVILASPDSVPIAVGPCLLAHGWERASRRADVGEATRPEYGMSVLESESMPRDVQDARRRLADVCASTREGALQALKDRAVLVLLGRSDSWQTVELWRTTLCCISNVDVRAGAPALESCVYAFAIVQALAVSAAEPLLLFTPQVLAKLFPLRQLLADSQILHTARMVVRLFWLAIHNASYGQDEAELRRAWRVTPWFGVSASLSGSQTEQDESSTLYSMVGIIAQIKKEQLCTSASSMSGWKRGPPPYVDRFDVTVPYSNTFVALPSLFPPLSLLYQEHTLPGDGESLQVLEDVQLVVRAFLPEDPDILPLLKGEEWNKLCPALDNSKKLRLTGGFGKRLMGLDRFLHWELRQSVEGYFGFPLLHSLRSVPAVRVVVFRRVAGHRRSRRGRGFVFHGSQEH